MSTATRVFIVPDGADFDSLYSARNDDRIGEKINKALEQLEDAKHADQRAVRSRVHVHASGAVEIVAAPLAARRSI